MHESHRTSVVEIVVRGQSSVKLRAYKREAFIQKKHVGFFRLMPTCFSWNRLPWFYPGWAVYRFKRIRAEPHCR